MKKYFCFLLFLLSAALLCANEAYPPEIAAWQENDFNNQRKAAAELVRNFRNAVASGAKKFIIPSAFTVETTFKTAVYSAIQLLTKDFLKKYQKNIKINCLRCHLLYFNGVISANHLLISVLIYRSARG